MNDPTADNLLHQLWTIAASAPNYDKRVWLALELAMRAIPVKIRAEAEELVSLYWQSDDAVEWSDRAKSFLDRLVANA